MKNKLSVEGYSNLYRDAVSGAIVNNSSDEYNNFMKRHEIKQKNKNKVDSMERELNYVKTELEEIKQLLFKISEKI